MAFSQNASCSNEGSDVLRQELSKALGLLSRHSDSRATWHAGNICEEGCRVYSPQWLASHAQSGDGPFAEAVTDGPKYSLHSLKAKTSLVSGRLVDSTKQQKLILPFLYS